ncbi:MAG: cysteine desulfurase [Nitrosospira sp.]|nr:cysteine desulfurase [Nitrosospira sp.]MDW7643229.1 cysteine desulfurase family protein [Nitrosomonadaceae bacterium]
MKKTYFDHNATTAIDNEVFDAMMPYFKEEFGNPSSPHSLGTVARQAVNRAREQVASSVGAQPSQVIFTSGGSEANNLFIQGAAGYLKPSRIIVSAIEHPCIMRPTQELTRGTVNKWSLRKLAVNKSGQIDLDDADRAISEQRPSLISVMLANNETGVIQDVATIAEKARNTGAWIHTDAIQAFGKIPLDFISLKVHAMTLSSHKIYGPKGAAALVIDKKLLLKPLIFGGGHENGFRSGTENIPAIVGFGLACQLAQNRITEMTVHISTIREYLEERLLNMGAIIFGLSASRLPNTCYFALPDIEGETLVICLDKAGFAVASGAACSSVTPGQSYVLEAMGVEPLLARCAVRVSLGSDNTITEIKDFLIALNSVVKMLRSINTLVAPN